MESLIAGKSHSAFIDFFDIGWDGLVVTKSTHRLRAEAKRFTVMGLMVYNDTRLHLGM